MSLRDELGADNNREFIGCYRREFLPEPLGPTRKIARQRDPPDIRKGFRYLLRDALDTRPAGGETLLGPAGGANRGPSLGMPAVMAHQRPAKPVLHQPGVAIRALPAMPAGAA